MTEMTTNYHSPWALIRWGGQLPGQRPRTKLAFIHDLMPGKPDKYRVRSLRGNGVTVGFTKSTRTILASDVLFTWRQRPTTQQIQKAKRRLKRDAI